MQTDQKPQLLNGLTSDHSHAAPSTLAEDSSKPFQFFGRVTYASETDASMVRDTLAVDPELRPLQVTRNLNVEGKDFVMKFAASDVRTLRAAVSTFCDLLALVTRTLEVFGQDSANSIA